MKKYYKFILLFIFGLFLFIPKDTFALTNYAQRFNDEEFNISGSTAYWYSVYSNFNNTWADAGGGYLRFNFSVTKISGSSTSQAIAPAAVSVSNGLGNEFICDIGSTSVNNTTWNTQTYSAICPVHFYSGGGLHHIAFNWMRSNGDNSTYHVWFDGRVTLEIPQFINIPDTSANDNVNTNKIITEQQKILQEQQKTTQATKDLDSTLKDDSIDTSDADDIFGLELDENSTLSGVITAPLGFLNHLSDTCTEPLHIPIFNTTFDLPCGTIFWGRNDVQAFRVIWNILIGGSIIYMLCVKLFKVVQDSLNPNKDNFNSLEV